MATAVPMTGGPAKARFTLSVNAKATRTAFSFKIVLTLVSSRLVLDDL